MTKIKEIKAREILDSRGNPTIEAEVETNKGIFVASVPSGASVGEREAIELRDGDEERYMGRGTLKAVENVEKIISNELEGVSADKQNEIDEIMIELDSTDRKSRLGANAIMAVSLACARAGAKSQDMELYEYISSISGTGAKMPSPCFNVINGGKHAGNKLAFQEFMINFQEIPFKEQIRRAAEMYQQLKIIIAEKYGKEAINVGDEGGFAPPISLPEEALDLIIKAAKELKYEYELNIFLDVAASEFFNRDKKIYFLNNKEYTREDLLEYYFDLCDKYPIVSIEDPFEQNDFDGFNMLNKKLDGDVLIIGDDLTVSNVKFIEKAYGKNAINGLLLKINQIGTVSEAIEAANLAKTYGWKVMVSHRSGETIDDFIADFAVGIGADYIKSGAPARGERVSKYNRLLKIKDILK